MAVEKAFPPLTTPVFIKGAEKFTVPWSRFFNLVGQRADAGSRTSNLADSYPYGLTITGVASTGQITLSAHVRKYPSGNQDVGSGAITASYNTAYWIYYDDTARTGGNVTYEKTTTAYDAFASFDNPDRHFVGSVTMPANAGASNTTGTPARPPGYA